MRSVTPNATVAARQRAVALGRDALNAWLVDLDAPGAASPASLDAAERARAASYMRPQDGARFAASRSALRLVLACYLGGAPGDLEYRVGPRGEPRVAGDEVRFSLARSGGVALIAVSHEAVGADLECVQLRPGIADLAAARFTAREAARIAGGCCGSPTESFYRHWTAKEAYLKAVGLGLTGLRDAELVCGARPEICFAGRPVPGWLLSTSSAADGYVTAIAGRTPVTNWRCLSGVLPATPGASAGWRRSPIRARS